MWAKIKEKERVEAEPAMMPWGPYKMAILDPDGCRLGLLKIHSDE